MIPRNENLEPCPHCRTDAGMRPSPDYRYKCDVCGKPRIPIDSRISKSTQNNAALLKEGHRSRLARIAWQISGVGFAGVGAMMALLAMGASALFDWGWVGNTTTAVFALIPMVVSVLMFSAGKKAGEKSKGSIDEAWRDAASRMYASLGGRVTSRQLAETMGIDEEYATQLMAEAEVQQLLAPSEFEQPVKVRVATEGDLEAEAWDEAEQALGNVPTQAMRARKG